MASRGARWLCVEALSRWEAGGSFAEEILHALQSEHRPEAQERALFTELFYGVLRNLARLDHCIAALRDSPVDPRTRQTLRTGLYQIFHLRIPDHAAVHATVEIAGRARGLANAVLRRAIRERERLLASIETAPLPLRTSHPAFLVERWSERFGPETAEHLCAWNNQPAPLTVRANRLKVTPGELARSTPEAQPHPFHPATLTVPHLPLPWILGGLCYVQDPSTLMACDLLAPIPGETVLDACAAPGGKTSYLAELMQNEGQIVACDAIARRLDTLSSNLARLGLRNARSVAHDWLGTTPAPFEPGSFDRILLDVPCSNTGVMRRRVDVRWRLRPDDFKRMQKRQVRIATAAARHLRPGGVLVYSTCSMEAEENEESARLIAAATPGLRLEETRACTPVADGVDGAFAARFVRQD